MTLGETAFVEIYPCLEGIIYNNLNELKIYELINTTHQLLKMEYLQNSTAIDLFKKVLPYIIHPNYRIQSEVLNLAKTLLNLLSQAEIYTYLRPDLLKYMKVNKLKSFQIEEFILITNDLLVKEVKESLSRVIFELESRNFKYNFKKNFEDDEAFVLIEDIIKYAKGNIPLRTETFKDEEHLMRFKATNDPISISNHIKKELENFSKTCKKDELIQSIERNFLTKLISDSHVLHQLNLPACYNTRRASTCFITKNDQLLCQENFKNKYLFKTLDIIIFQEMIDLVVFMIII